MTPARLVLLATDPPLDPSADEGRRLLQRELAKYPYADHRSLVTRFEEWIADQLARAVGAGASTVTKLLLLLAVAVLIGVVAYAVTRVRRGRRATGSVAVASVLEEHGLTARDYRERAASAESRGEHSAALLDWFRALVREGEERALLPERPGGTAHELVEMLAAVLPDDRYDLRAAAARFDDVRYGQAEADASGSRAMQELDARLRKRRPVHLDDPAADAALVAPGRWAP